MIRSIDINADMGEGAEDAGLMPLVTSANIACGAHAGDDDSMRRTTALALEHGVAIGAHPGYPDRAGFGRREIGAAPEEVGEMLLEQIARLDAIVRREGGRLLHVKPHGALYNRASIDPPLADAVAAAVRQFDPLVVLVGLSGSALIAAGEKAGLGVAREAFADRGYRADGTLQPRDLPGAVLTDAALAAERITAIVHGRKIRAVGGEEIMIAADTFCVHSDTPGAIAFLAEVRRRLREEGISVQRLEAPRA